MTVFDFDRVIDRRHGDSLKWNRYGDRDVLPLWVADMDFAAPPPVLEALQQRVAHGVLGYAKPGHGLVEAALEHLAGHYAWSVDPAWIVWLPGVVTGLSLACRAVEGDVLTATPVYPPFLSVPGASGRPLVTVPLQLANGRWGWDFAAMEAALTPSSRLLLLCHPHNPVGRVWDVAELAALAEFCERHDLFVCSDEIHCDLILDEDYRHQPLALAQPGLAARCITLMAPSKTYNIPGLACAFAVIADPALRRRFTDAMRGIVPDVNVLGLAGAEAAFRHGEPWRREVLAVLRRNRDRVQAAVDAMPGLSMTPVEATYLAWIDARGLGLADPALHFEQAGVGLSSGVDFGNPGWVRLNFACPASTLDLALERMRGACACSA
ncbi:MalY/PatB family protein [Propionivibrio dicarboxylicus]|uniref:cysteine-S-conjugate beta-lyase n=1 Tax=Propionivibrio dicarboxylicus TaxID=83767 RepID=A0A1G7W5M1_9RHOO|nr:PatB family C-S lyase [Propionivibrio dicarboxylicus]SDG67284.1 cystathione beta-lyase [Propionivibrio dicarboxylicus]